MKPYLVNAVHPILKSIVPFCVAKTNVVNGCLLFLRGLQPCWSQMLNWSVNPDKEIDLPHNSATVGSLQSDT